MSLVVRDSRRVGTGGAGNVEKGWRGRLEVAAIRGTRGGVARCSSNEPLPSLELGRGKEDELPQPQPRRIYHTNTLRRPA